MNIREIVKSEDFPVVFAIVGLSGCVALGVTGNDSPEVSKTANVAIPGVEPGKIAVGAVNNENIFRFNGGIAKVHFPEIDQPFGR